MKKIICIISIIALLVLNYGATVFAETTENPSNPTAETTPYHDYVIGELKDGYKLCFNIILGPPWMEAFYVQYDKYVFVNFLGEGEEGHGFFVVKGDEKLMLSEAFDKGITDIEEVVKIITDKDITSSNPVCVVDTEKVEGNWKDLFSEFHFSQDDNSSEPTSSPTTEPTDKATEPVTTNPTESSTDKPTEPATTEPTVTEPPTDTQTEPAVTESTEPSTDKPTEPVTTEPIVINPQPTENKPTTPAVVKPTVKKRANPVKVTVKTKTVKAKKLKIKKQSVKPLTITKAQGRFAVTLVKNGTSNKIRAKVSVSKKGVITLKKGNYTKGTYKIKVKIAAKGNSNFKAKTIYKTLKIKIK